MPHGKHAHSVSRWNAKFEGAEVPTELYKEVNDAAASRLQRRPSWSAKFEGPHDEEVKVTSPNVAPAQPSTTKDAEDDHGPHAVSHSYWLFYH